MEQEATEFVELLICVVVLYLSFLMCFLYQGLSCKTLVSYNHLFTANVLGKGVSTAKAQ